MKKLIVMSYTDQSIEVYNYDENIWESPEDFTNEDGIYVVDNNCHYMVVDVVQITVK